LCLIVLIELGGGRRKLGAAQEQNVGVGVQCWYLFRWRGSGAQFWGI
jgi:hypothetical protein